MSVETDCCDVCFKESETYQSVLATDFNEGVLDLCPSCVVKTYTDKFLYWKG